MRLFGWKQPREGARPALSRGGGGVAGLGEWPQSYEAQVRAAFAGNAIAQRAVKLVAESVAAVPIKASDPVLAMLVAARTGGQVLLESAAAQMLLHGNAYIQVLRDGSAEGAGAAAALYALRPERVSVEVDAGGWPTAYRYTVAERRVRLDAEGPRPDLIHVRSFNPIDDHYGMGCLGAASGAVAVHNAAGMPDIAADACAIAFGNFRAGYLITERAETAILRDPYSNKPFVSFYATKRVGGCVADSEAIKLLKFAA